VFDAIVMAHVIDLLEIIAGEPIDGFPAPQYLAAVSHSEPREDTQQAGLATAVRTFNDQHLARIEADFELLEQQAIVTHAAKIASLE